MSTAYQPTEEDVENVLASNTLADKNTSGKSLELIASEVFGSLDFDLIEQAALYGDSLDQQRDYANDEIARQLREMGLLEPGIKPVNDNDTSHPYPDETFPDGINTDLQCRNLAMESNEVTKITQVIHRGDGSEVRIVVQACFGAGLHRSIDVYVHSRQSAAHDWTLCSDSPHPDWKSMSVEDYVKHGRSPMLQAVSHGELLRAMSLVGAPMAHYETNLADVASDPVDQPR